MSNLDFEKSVSVELVHYEGAIFWGVFRVTKLFDNSA